MAHGAASGVKVVVVGGGIAGLAAAHRLEVLLERVEVILLEWTHRLGGKLLTEEVDGFLIEGAADSFLSRKERGIALCEEIGIDEELIGRRPENARSFVRVDKELHALPEGLSGLIPTNLEALEDSMVLSKEGKKRLAAEVDLPPARSGGDESIAAFVSRRLGREAYERIVEPLTAGIYGGDGEQLSLRATFPQLRSLELEHGSVLRGLAEQSPAEPRYPPFVSLRSGMHTLVDRLTATLERTAVHSWRPRTVQALPGRFAIDCGHVIQADGVVVAAPAYAASNLLATLDSELADLLAEIPYAASAIVTLGYRLADVPHPLGGYGYVVPAIERSDVLACTWSSSKWVGRAPEGHALLRVYLRRIPGGSDDRLVELARAELRLLGIEKEPVVARVHRWPRGMPQYVLGHSERLERIDALVAEHPGLGLAGAAYRGVGIPDCIDSGEQAAESVVRALTGARA
jgi:protoporphyrinogen/coproporphyrinogen III oxidase